jgi:hypothetical protein
MCRTGIKKTDGHDNYSHCPNPRAISGLTNTIVIKYLKISCLNDLRKTSIHIEYLLWSSFHLINLRKNVFIMFSLNHIQNSLH